MSATNGFYLGTPTNLGQQPATADSPVGTGPVPPFHPTLPIGIDPRSFQAPSGPMVPDTPNYSFAPQTVSPTGPSQGFDPQFLQNLTTYIGGLFSRPQGNLGFNPLGNLSDVPSQQLGYGNAPLFGLPNTLLGDALNNSLSNTTPVNGGGQPSTTPPSMGGGGGAGGGGTAPVDLQGDWWNLNKGQTGLPVLGLPFAT